ncbi:MAG: tetratricopeptide repeat protein [Endomicrobium sp.]|jgi:tol-pal system protein YbgF|nr:tetratricopeptide repeat protein [Endomicrobium sp.]
MKQCKLALIGFTAMLFICGCIPLNSREITNLKGEVSQLQIQYRELQQNHADLYTKVDAASITIDVLNASMQDLQNKVFVLNQTIQDFQIILSKNLKGNSSESVLPSSLYQSAYGDFSMGKFDLAYSGFQSFVNEYPNVELVPQAQFYMGECFYSRKHWEKALEEYEKIEQNYKSSELVSSARLKMALCCELLGKNSEAKTIFLSIIRDFPQSQESLTAKEKIKIYNNAQKR